jgi:hypothetical protein
MKHLLLVLILFVQYAGASTGRCYISDPDVPAIQVKGFEHERIVMELPGTLGGIGFIGIKSQEMPFGEVRCQGDGPHTCRFGEDGVTGTITYGEKPPASLALNGQLIVLADDAGDTSVTSVGGRGFTYNFVVANQRECDAFNALPTPLPPSFWNGDDELPKTFVPNSGTSRY